MLLNKPKIFRKTKIIIGQPFTFEEYYGKKLSEEDINNIDSIIREKMIEQHNLLKKITKK